MRAYGPLLAHVYGVDEDTVLASWTIGKFQHYKQFALELIRRNQGGVQ